ncbi:MAG: hypothetical protein ACYCTZ_03930 [Candidatus Dormibacteria bacterium]
MQPPVKQGVITSTLPLTRSVSDVPFRGIMSGSGKLIRMYKEYQALCERIWTFLESMEQGLFDEAERVDLVGKRIAAGETKATAPARRPADKTPAKRTPATPAASRSRTRR